MQTTTDYSRDQRLAAFILTTHAFVLLAIPLLLPNVSGIGWLALLTVPLAAPHWGLIHEGIHKHLHPDPEKK